MLKYFIVDRFCLDDDQGDYFNKDGKVCQNLPMLNANGGSEYSLYISTDGRCNEGYRSYAVSGLVPRNVCAKILGLIKNLNQLWVTDKDALNMYGRYTISETESNFVLSHYFVFSLDDGIGLEYPRCAKYFLDKGNLQIVDIKLNFSLEEDDDIASSDMEFFKQSLLDKMAKSFIGVFEEIAIISKKIHKPIDYIEVGRFDIVNEKDCYRCTDSDNYKKPNEVYLCVSSICKETGSWEKGVLGTNAVCITF